MPIAISCAGCDKQYQVKDELAGKKIRCPQCSEVITIPAKKPSRIEVLDDEDDDDQDDEDFYREPRALPEPKRRRTERFVPAKAKTKKKKTRRSAGGSANIGLIVAGIVAGLLLLAVGLCFLFPPAATVIAGGFVLAGFGLNVVGGIGCLVKAFQEDVVCGLLYLFVPFYGLYYIATRWEDVSTFATCLFGGIGLYLTGIALMIGSFASMSAGAVPGTSPFPGQPAAAMPPFNPNPPGVAPVNMPPQLPPMTPPITPPVMPPTIPGTSPPGVPSSP